MNEKLESKHFLLEDIKELLINIFMICLFQVIVLLITKANFPTTYSLSGWPDSRYDSYANTIIISGFCTLSLPVLLFLSRRLKPIFLPICVFGIIFCLVFFVWLSMWLHLNASITVDFIYVFVALVVVSALTYTALRLINSKNDASSAFIRPKKKGGDKPLLFTVVGIIGLLITTKLLLMLESGSSWLTISIISPLYVLFLLQAITFCLGKMQFRKYLVVSYMGLICLAIWSMTFAWTYLLGLDFRYRGNHPIIYIFAYLDVLPLLTLAFLLVKSIVKRRVKRTDQPI